MMFEDKMNDTGIRARAILVCLISAAGIYLSVTNHIVAIAVFGLNLLSLLFLNDQEIFWEMLFLLPFTTIYKYSTSSSSLFTYLTVFAALRLIIKNVRVSVGFVTLFVLFSAVSLLGVGGALLSFVKIISNVLLLVCFVKLVKREIFPSMVLAISTGEIIASFIGLRKTSWPALSAFFDTLKEEYIGTERIARFTGLYLDPNYYSIIVIVCLYCLLLYMYKKEIKYQVGVPMFIALSVFGCMTYSRVFYIALVGVLAAVLIMRLKNRSVVSTVLLMVLIAVAFGYYASKTGILDKVLIRFQRDDISSGRFDIWAVYSEEILNSVKILLIGAGLGANLPTDTGAHNFYIETVYHIGLIGTAIYYGLLYNILSVRVSPLFKRGLANWGLTAVLLFMFATLGMLFQFDFVYILMLDWMVLNTDMKLNFSDTKGERI